MQTLPEYEAEERRYQQLTEAYDLSAQGHHRVHTPPSHPEDADFSSTPWAPQSALPTDLVVHGVSLEPIQENATSFGSPYHMPLTASPLVQTKDINGSDFESDQTLAEMELATDQSPQATGVSSRARPVAWGVSPVDKPREAIESSPRSQLIHRRTGSSRQSTNQPRSTMSRSNSRHGTSSRRTSTDHATSRAGSRQNSDGGHRHRETRNPVISHADSNGNFVGLQTEVPQAIAQAVSHILSADTPAPHSSSTQFHPLFYANPSLLRPATMSEPTVSQSDLTINHNVVTPPSRQSPGALGSPSSRPAVPRESGRKRRRVGMSGVYTHHANYSSDTLYSDIVSAAGLNYGLPFRAPTSSLPSLAAPPPCLLVLPTTAAAVQPRPSQSASRSSTGRFPLATALDGMQSPRLPVADDFGTESDTRADVERFAPVQQNTDAWKPTWEVFPLKVYRGYDLRVIEIQRDWDDEELLRELGIAYDRLRTWYRKYFSVMNVWYVTMVAINQHFVFPQRVGPAKISPHRNMRMRYLLAHPEHVKGQHEIMRALTERRDYGVEFVERAEMGRMVLLASALAAFPLGIAIVYGISNGDWPGAFGIAAFFSQAFSLPLGVLATMFVWREC